MSTLILRLSSPLQAWGIDSKFERRNTERIPTKSGVVGLLAAALGRKRTESVNDLSALEFGVRIDRSGELLRDYQTAKHPYTDTVGKYKERKYITFRYYLMDAVFVVGLEGDIRFLSEIEFALCHPAFPLFLGRRSCPPEGRVVLGIREGKSLLEALYEEPWQVSDYLKRDTNESVNLRIFLDSDENEDGAYLVRDVPISFDQQRRQFGFRFIKEYTNPVTLTNKQSRWYKNGDNTAHDPMGEI